MFKDARNPQSKQSVELNVRLRSITRLMKKRCKSMLEKTRRIFSSYKLFEKIKVIDKKTGKLMVVKAWDLPRFFFIEIAFEWFIYELNKLYILNKL